MWATLTNLASASPSALLVFLAFLLFSLTVICVAIVTGMCVCLKGTAPSDRPVILQQYVEIARALRDLLCFWRRR